MKTAFMHIFAALSQRALYTSCLWNPLVVEVELRRAQVGKSLDCEVFPS